jgi:hypothetical protein
LEESDSRSSEKKLLLAAAVIVAVVALAAFAEYISWAGELTSPLQHLESLDVRSSTVPVTGALLISVTNDGPASANVTSVLFNQTILSPGSMTMGGSFTKNPDGSYLLPRGLKGTMSVPREDLGPLKSGETYDVTIVTSMGNSYPSNVSWP